MNADQHHRPRDVGVTDIEVKLRAERVAEIRHRIRAGSYDLPDVASDVARRMLDRGDL